MKIDKRLTILIIEDNEFESLLIKEHLSNCNFEIFIAENFAKGKHLLTRGTSFDAILLDLTLPDSEGVNTFHKLQFYAPKIPIIILTGIEDEEIEFDTLQNGAQDYLLKRDVNGSVLKRSIRYAIERKQTELRLKESLDLNQKIFSATTLGVLTYQSAGPCVFANEAASRIINLPVEKLLNQNFHTINSWKSSELYSVACDVLKTGLPKNKEISFVSTSGKELLVDFYFATFTKSDELHLLLILKDNTNKKKIAKDLEWKNYLMEIFLQHIPNSVYFKDKDGRFTEVSKAMANKFGYNDPEELKGKTDFDLFTLEHAEAAFKDEQKILNTGIGLFNYEERETHSEKPDTWVLSSKMPLLDNNGDVIGTFGISADVTDRKKAEQELIKSQTQLNEAMDVARLYFWEYDMDNHLLIFNDKFCRLLGVNSGDHVACSIPYHEYLEKYVHPDDVPVVNQEHVKVRSSGNPKYFSQYEYRLLLWDGSIRHFMVRLRADGNQDNKPFRYFGIMQDITERKIALQESYEALNKVDSVKTEFLSFISHELRTPLNGIVGAVNLLKNQENSSAIKNLVEILDKSVSNLEIFTDNASYYSKLSNNYKPDISTFSLKDSIQFAILENENAIMEKNLKIQFDLPDRITVQADQDLIYKSVFNILHIILFFSKKNNTIIIRVEEESTQLIIFFENKEVVFPTYLLKNDISLNDTNIDQQIGLSFYIIKQIMELHRGSLKILNSDTTGASIVFSLNK